MKHTQEQLVEKLKGKFSTVDLQWVKPENGDAYFMVPTAEIANVLQYLKESSELAFDFLMNVSAFDGLKWVEGGGDFVEVTYHMHSYKHRHTLVLKVRTPRVGGKVPTVTHLFGCADFQEREVFDHFGVTFVGHPNLIRILLPDDWTGFPLLKDYQEQEEYNGIATTRPSML